VEAGCTDPKLGSTLGYLGMALLRAFEVADFGLGSNNWSREMNLKNLQNRLSKLEQAQRKIATEADCICLAPDAPPRLLLQAERDAVSAVLCPVHGSASSRDR
jgi:hypothetical protein